MVSLDTTGDPALTITGTETSTAGDNWRGYALWHRTPTVKKETKKEKVTRLALEKNRASWVQFNEPKPRIKQVFKPRNNFNQRR